MGEKFRGNGKLLTGMAVKSLSYDLGLRPANKRRKLACKLLSLVDMRTPANSRLFCLVLAFGLVSACDVTVLHPRSADERMIDVPPFAIAVKLSPNAAQRLRDMGEGIKVLAMFDGDPLPGQGKYNPPMRDVYLGSAEKLVDATKVVKFDGVRIPQKDYDRLADKNYVVTINTLTARKVARDNLLKCSDPISVRIQSMKGKTTEIRCSLIGESDAPMQ